MKAVKHRLKDVRIMHPVKLASYKIPRCSASNFFLFQLPEATEHPPEGRNKAKRHSPFGQTSRTSRRPAAVAAARAANIFSTWCVGACGVTWCVCSGVLWARVGVLLRTSTVSPSLSRARVCVCVCIILGAPSLGCVCGLGSLLSTPTSLYSSIVQQPLSLSLSLSLSLFRGGTLLLLLPCWVYRCRSLARTLGN